MIVVLSGQIYRGLRYLAYVSVCVYTLTHSAALYAQSSASSELKIERADAVRISNIDDWLIGIFEPNDNINNIQYNWDAICVFTSTGRYRVEVTSTNGGGQLNLESSAGDLMDYEIYSYTKIAENNYELTRHLTPIINMNNLLGSQQLDCADEPQSTNLWFAALVRPQAFNAAAPGIYRDVVTIVVSPE